MLAYTCKVIVVVTPQVLAADQQEHRQHDVRKNRLGRMKLIISNGTTKNSQVILQTWHFMPMVICYISDLFQKVMWQLIGIRRSEIQTLWLIPDLKKFLFERNIAKKIASSEKSNKTWVCFQAMRNKVNTAIKKAKVSYNNLFFKSNHVNIKHKWKKINTIFSWTLQPIQIHNLKIGDTCTICTTANEISNGLNQHFCMFFLCHMSSPKKSD